MATIARQKQYNYISNLLQNALRDEWSAGYAAGFSDASNASSESTVPLRNAEDVAMQFHDAYETLAPSFGYETRKDTRVPWENVPTNNKLLMIAVIRRLFGKYPVLERALAHKENE